MSGSIEQLIRMANDIASFFAAETDHAVAAAGVENHVRKFWDPRMRRKIIEHWRAGNTELSPLAAEAIALLAEHAATQA